MAFVAVLSVACVRIEHRATGGGIATDLLGEWSGNWASGLGPQQGTLHMRLQEFGGRPVVNVDTQVPCLEDGAYELVLTGGQFVLRRDGTTVFAADFDPVARRLTGNYQCAADRGGWTANWLHELPPLGDVSGTWSGEFSVGSPPTIGSFAMDLIQRWGANGIEVGGTVAVDGLPAAMTIDAGAVTWTGDNFELLVRGAQDGLLVAVQGVGRIGAAPTSSGVVLVDGGSGPLVVGSWTATRQGF